MRSESEFAAQLELVRQGDSAALNSVFEACRSVIRRHARGLLNNRQAARVDSSDIVQETMTQAFQDIRKFRGNTRGEWMAWLRSILVAKANRLRRHDRAAKRSTLHEEPDIAQEIAQEAAGPDAGLLEAERRTALTNALEQLPEAMSEVIVRRVFLGQRFEEVGTAMGKSPGTARVTWFRAVKKLRELLPPEFALGDDFTPPS